MAIFTTADATAMITTITGFISDNIGGILLVVGMGVGIRYVTRFFNRGTKGKL